MSKWTTWPIKRFATAFAASQVWIEKVARDVADHGPRLALCALEARTAGEHLETAFDNMPAELQREILAIRAEFEKGAQPAKPPVRRINPND